MEARGTKFSQARRRLSRIWNSYYGWLNLALFAISLALLSLNLAMNSNAFRERNWILKKVSQPCKAVSNWNKRRTDSIIAPLLDSVEIQVISKKMNATLLLPDELSIYRQDPSREVDLAWQRLGDLRLIPLTREEVTSIGKDPDDAVKFPESFGLGAEAYAGRVDVFHQVHCLDALRREAYFEHYYGRSYPDGYNDTTEMHRLHLSHCIEYLLQNIMCQASTDVYTHIWTDGVEHPFPDFGVNHQCRDYDVIKKWQDRNAVDVDEFVALRAPQGAKVHRMTRKFKELHGFFEAHEDDGNYGDEIA
jgi:hypothetical protein